MARSIYRIGIRIRELRKEKGLTQRELALRIGTSSKYLSILETSVRYPSLEMLVCIARELDVSLDELIQEDDHRRFEAEVRRLFNEASAEEQAFLCDMISDMMKNIRNHKGIL